MALEPISQLFDLQSFAEQREQSVTKLQGIFVTLINRNKELREKLEISQARYEKAEKEYGEKKQRLECEIKALKNKIAPLRKKLKEVIADINHQIERVLLPERERDIPSLKYHLALYLWQDCCCLEEKLNKHYGWIFKDYYSGKQIHVSTVREYMDVTERNKHGITTSRVVVYMEMLIGAIMHGRENIAKYVPHKI